MGETAKPIVLVTTPNRLFEGHGSTTVAVAIFSDGRRMVTAGSLDNTLRLWDLKDGVVMKKMNLGYGGWLKAVAVSRNGQLIASGDKDGELIAWQANSGESLTEAVRVPSGGITSLDFSPDGAALATGSWDGTTKMWCTKTWQVQGNPIECCAFVNCLRFSPSGEHLAMATLGNIEIWNPRTSNRIAKFQASSSGAFRITLAWTTDGTRLLSAGGSKDPTIREWGVTSTWQQVGEPWGGHTRQINSLVVNSTGTFVASASDDCHVRLWRLVDRQTVAIFKHSRHVLWATFCADGKYVISGGPGKMMSEWAVPQDALLNDVPNSEQSEAPEDALSENATREQARNKILAIYTIVRRACIIGDLPTAEGLLTQQIDADGNNYNTYANRSLVAARKGDWDRALCDALTSISIQHSVTGYISQGIALCGKKLFQDAAKAFDLAFMFTDGDSKTTHLLLLVKAIALFNANEHEDAMVRVQGLAAACPDADALACRVVEAYLCVQLGISALDDARNEEAADHFTTAINTGAFSSEQAIHSKYEVFVVLFGWDLKSLWLIANQERCNALLRAGRLAEAHEAYRSMKDVSDEATMATCRDWSIAFEHECCTFYTSNGDRALAAKDYDRSIELYSVVVELDSENDTVFGKRCTAQLEKMKWNDALLDAQKVIKLNPSSYFGYQLKHTALHGARRYDEAIATFEIMLSKLNDTRQITPALICFTLSPELHKQYITSFEAASTIREVVHARLENIPHRLLNTTTGRLYDRGAQIHAFKTSPEYKELLSSTMKHADSRMESIKEAVAKYFRCVTLSHRWEERELRLRDIQDKSVYELDPDGSVVKLQSFCKTVREAGYRWAWVDTCCIDQTNNVEVQESVNSMFAWYRHSALTVIYLSDVPPSSTPGGLAKSVWNQRGWTVQEFLASKIILFYQKDWTLYLDDRSPNHKDSTAIMRELGDATGIYPQALVAFHPGMRGAREKLQWVSRRVTTLPEDIAYSLFGIFGIHLPVIYGERKQNALGRLLQEIIAQSGDITCLDWVGKPSEFNSCLPADITSYGALPCVLPSLSEDQMQTSVSLLRDVADVELAIRLYDKLDYLSAPRFAARRLRLPCIAFAVTEIGRVGGEDQQTYSTFAVKVDGLHDLLITTKDTLTKFSRARPPRRALFLVRPWDRCLLELPDIVDYTESLEDLTPSASPSDDLREGSSGGNKRFDSTSHSRALRLIVRLGQPFSAFLLAQQWGAEYKRIASDQNITAQVKDMASIHHMMDIRTLEIL